MAMRNHRPVRSNRKRVGCCSDAAIHILSKRKWRCRIGGAQAPSYPLVGAIVIDEGRADGTEPDLLDCTEKNIMGADRSHLDDAAIEYGYGGKENGAAGGEHQQAATSGRSPIRKIVPPTAGSKVQQT